MCPLCLANANIEAAIFKVCLDITDMEHHHWWNGLMPRVMGNHSSLTHIMEERPRYATPEGEISVLVHCQIRVSCSAVVVIAYYILYNIDQWLE